MSADALQYQAIIAASERVSWALEDVLPERAALDFQRLFLPTSLAPLDELEFLTLKEARALNQITGHAYLNLFVFVEEYIVADVLQHAQAHIFGDEGALRAFLRFAEEEVKHQALFKRFRGIFQASFGSPCGLVEGADQVAGAVLMHQPLAVMLTTYALELSTQKHYTHRITRADDDPLEPLFVGMLKHHWLEEAQHAQLDAMELRKMAEYLDATQKEEAVGEYLAICDAFDGILGAQAELDVESLEIAVGRRLTDPQREAVSSCQHRNYRGMFLLMGMEHSVFRRTLGDLSPAGLDRVVAQAHALRGVA